MSKPQYEFFHFEKYKRPEVSRIEAHHERTKEKYASNPDIDPARKHLNFHLIEPVDRYNKIINQQVKEGLFCNRPNSLRKTSHSPQKGLTHTSSGGKMAQKTI